MYFFNQLFYGAINKFKRNIEYRKKRVVIKHKWMYLEKKKDKIITFSYYYVNRFMHYSILSIIE